MRSANPDSSRSTTEPTGPADRIESALTRREFLRLAGLTAPGTALVACNGSPAANPTASGGNPVQLVYRDWRTDWFPPMAQAQLDEGRIDYPDGSWSHDDSLRSMRLLTGDSNGDNKTDVWGCMIDINQLRDCAEARQ